jgi:ABC-type transport system involved in Fe-S cluster assembly fused permease/ATPase subunit
VRYLARKLGPTVSHLSGGQKQKKRVAIAPTILKNAMIFLLLHLIRRIHKKHK